MNNFNEVLKNEIIKEILFQVKSSKIKSFQADGKVLDISNIRDLQSTDLIQSKILLSNKFIPLICENFDLEEVLSVLSIEKKDIAIITHDNRFMNINVTFHSTQQLIKRFIYIYINNQNKFEFGLQMNELYSKYFSYCINLVLNNKIDDIKKDEVILELITRILKMTKPFSKSNLGRHKDVWNFELRERIHESALKYFCHPFLFIIEDGFIKTIELYSSSVSMHRANKFTSDNFKFKEYIHKTVGV